MTESTARAEAERLAEAEKIVEFEGYLPFPYCQWILERYKAASEENERLRKEVAAFESWKKAELVPRSELCDREISNKLDTKQNADITCAVPPPSAVRRSRDR